MGNQLTNLNHYFTYMQWWKFSSSDGGGGGGEAFQIFDTFVLILHIFLKAHYLCPVSFLMQVIIFVSSILRQRAVFSAH